MKLCFLLGTRPEVIKLSPLIREAVTRGIPFFIMHTGQHFSHDMDGRFFEELGLPAPVYHLGIRSSASHLQGEHTGKMLIAIERVLLAEKPDVVIVQGDTNTVLAGALAVRKLRTAPSYLTTRLAHVEAGLRSFDGTMTEEVNRIVADQLADYNFAPSEKAKQHLLREGISSDRIFVTGNTIVDAVMHAAEASASSAIIAANGLAPKQYFFATLHRQENVDAKEVLEELLLALKHISQAHHMPVVLSLHPRTDKQMKHFSLELPQEVRAIAPVGFADSLKLQKEAKLVLTDSGGMQEEASILGVPCVTLRTSTERQETVDAGVNVIAGTRHETIERAVDEFLNKTFVWRPIYGDGTAAKKIMDILCGSPS
jgi:UDP-N-acetylglucosamine 2-epimerase (non-hydrolysing)